jgi:hypothetical protein
VENTPSITLVESGFELKRPQPHPAILFSRWMQTGKMAKFGKKIQIRFALQKACGGQCGYLWWRSAPPPWPPRGTDTQILGIFDQNKTSEPNFASLDANRFSTCTSLLAFGIKARGKVSAGGGHIQMNNIKNSSS